MSKNNPGAFPVLQFKAFMSWAYVKNVLFLIVFSLTSASLKAQDSLVFRNLKTEAVTVLSVTDGEVRYQKYGDQIGEVHIAKASDLFHVRYQNGKVHRFSDNGSDDYSLDGIVTGFKKVTFQLDFLFQDAWGCRTDDKT
jgi:hypothetical protein